VAAAFGVITLAASPLGPIINAIVIGITAIQAIKFAGGVLAGIKTITGAFLGFLGFLKVTIAPFLIAFFSGPAGWTVLAVAAVVAMAVAFRQPIGDFLKWLPGAFGSAWSTITNAIARTWSGLVQSMSNAFNGFLQGIRNSINAVSGQVNRLIRAFNRLNGPQISQIPQFAQGGFVRRPTMAVIGEGGEPEYVVPQSKAMSFANNIVAGRTGEQALRTARASQGIMASRVSALDYRRAMNIDYSRRVSALDYRRASSPDTSGSSSGRITSMGGGGVAFSNPMANMNTTQVKSLGPVEVKQNLRIDRVERRSDGDYVTLGAAEKLAADASTNAVNQMVRLLQQPSFRREVGIA
jgi:hypothetical protein